MADEIKKYLDIYVSIFKSQFIESRKFTKIKNSKDCLKFYKGIYKTISDEKNLELKKVYTDDERSKVCMAYGQLKCYITENLNSEKFKSLGLLLLKVQKSWEED